ncbi:DedA family protein [Rhodanobacter sp. A1T4]|jgi:membrane protein YqaA with SNARE-associated domain|uniref:YqaA family protein n=1 Tax=Rhodanobacter sp. A1T4 TaxID=2723087 RepID=UPI001617C366|nr:DedA family protein [Rhodanobacter sp. A1T4]MBB6246315.1 membrane protein YqaA with SNARE-associated domain [Rhodanobacter sp. A1T4]
MRLFGKLYAQALVWARSSKAIYYLCGLSFVEAFIFPIPPEVMLAPMMLGKRHKAFHFANLSLLFSLLGALVGYALGHWAFQALRPVLDSLHLLVPIEQGVTVLRQQMVHHQWGLFGVLILAALQPVVPMKFVTWACGIIGVPVLPFLVCIGLGRGKRVWLLALLIRLFGERAERILHKYIEWIGWIALVLLGLLLVWWLWLR